MYVTRGLGTAWTPIRLIASPEVVLLTLTEVRSAPVRVLPLPRSSLLHVSA